MSLYLYQVAYTPESLAAQVREPQDRIVGQLVERHAVWPAALAWSGRQRAWHPASGQPAAPQTRETNAAPTCPEQLVCHW